MGVAADLRWEVRRLPRPKGILSEACTERASGGNGQVRFRRHTYFPCSSFNPSILLAMLALGQGARPRPIGCLSGPFPRARATQVSLLFFETVNVR